MAEIPKDMKSLLFPRDTRWAAWCWLVCLFLGFAFLIVGIINDAANKKLGLEPTNWFIILVAFWLLALGSYLTAYFAAKEG